MTIRDVWQGARAAFETPAWIGGERLAGLLTFPADAPAVPRVEPAAALAAARRVLRVLSWLPGGRWRTSCLYESVAECVVLRRVGIPAAVCIGVKKDGAATTGIVAHAWVARRETDTRFHGFATLTVLAELRAQRWGRAGRRMQ